MRILFVLSYKILFGIGYKVRFVNKKVNEIWDIFKEEKKFFDWLKGRD